MPRPTPVWLTSFRCAMIKSTLSFNKQGEFASHRHRLSFVGSGL